MSKGWSGLFENTIGDLVKLEEDYLFTYTSLGGLKLDFPILPGSEGIIIPKRLNTEQMIFLTQKYGIEFAQVYVLGKGKNGSGDKYFIYSGDDHSVHFPLSKNIILINHTHPRGSAKPSKNNLKLIRYLSQLGSSQHMTEIIQFVRKMLYLNRRKKII